MDKDEVERLIRKILSEEISAIKGQFDLLPDSVKERHVGEGVRFIRAGTVANRPTTPEKDGAVYYATDENKLYIGDTDAWLEETFT